jgi:hypothetical protein
MVAYEFYVEDGIKGPNLIGILPERRKNATRITKESILKWGRLAASGYADANSIYFVRIRI